MQSLSRWGTKTTRLLSSLQAIKRSCSRPKSRGFRVAVRMSTMESSGNTSMPLRKRSLSQGWCPNKFINSRCLLIEPNRQVATSRFLTQTNQLRAAPSLIQTYSFRSDSQATPGTLLSSMSRIWTVTKRPSRPVRWLNRATKTMKSRSPKRTQRLVFSKSLSWSSGFRLVEVTTRPFLQWTWADCPWAARTSAWTW